MDGSPVYTVNGMGTKRCPRCGSCLLSGLESVVSTRLIWQCIGCGREILQDPDERERDEAMFQRVKRDRVPSPPDAPPDG